MGSRRKPQTPRRSERIKAGLSPTSKSPRSKSLKIDLSALGEAEESNSDELISSPTYHKRKARPRKTKALPVDDDDDDDDDEESDVVIPGRKNKKLRTDTPEPEAEPATNLATDDNDNSSDDDDIVAFTPSRRGSRKIPQQGQSPMTPTKLRSEQDELDLEEDLEDLRDTGENILQRENLVYLYMLTLFLQT
jgi:hypothetical protein